MERKFWEMVFLLYPLIIRSFQGIYNKDLNKKPVREQFWIEGFEFYKEKHKHVQIFDLKSSIRRKHVLQRYDLYSKREDQNEQLPCLRDRQD